MKSLAEKSSNSAKLKASNQEESLHLWKKNFEKWDFNMDQIKKVLKSLQDGKACGVDKIPAEIWKLPDFHQLLFTTLQQSLAYSKI